MQLNFVLVCLFSLALITTADQSQFVSWMQQHNKVYSLNEYALRYANFMANLRTIEAQNAKEDGLVYGLNQFSDLSVDEFKDTVLMKTTEPVESVGPMNFVPAVGAPAAFDWRTQKAVTAVKDQGQCGSCWAFSATQAIESSWILSGKTTMDKLNLAPQQLVDCDTVDLGCNGGWPEKAMSYVISAGGQEGASNYPYTAKDGTCRFTQNYIEAKIGSYQLATKKRDETTLQANLVSWGPLSICVDASNWQHYKSGVMTHTQCCISCQLDHAVQLVGYNTNVTSPYWIVRNSWGVSWGIEGYIYLQIGSNSCGITDHVYWPSQ